MDVSTPSAQAEVGSYDIPGLAEAGDVALAGGNIYVAGAEAGLVILSMGPPTSWIYLPIVMH